jgi:hypothetical protein
MNLTQLKRAIKQLTPEQRLKLQDFLAAQTAIDRVQQKPAADHITYRKEFVRCGKEGCKCNNGKLHGPYYYAYWSKDGTTKSQYVGKKMPKGVKYQTMRASD